MSTVAICDAYREAPSAVPAEVLSKESVGSAFLRLPAKDRIATAEHLAPVADHCSMTPMYGGRCRANGLLRDSGLRLDPCHIPSPCLRFVRSFS